MKQLVLGILAHVDAGKTTLSEALLYRSGQRRKPRLTDEMFRSVGELMALSGQISSFGEELAREIHCSGSEMAQKMRSGYDEAKEKLLTGCEELARRARKNQAESRELWDAICQMLDRYL